MGSEIIVGGQRYACAVPVVTWYESGLTFPGLPMRPGADLVVLHHTGGEGDARATHRTLCTRRGDDGKILGLSVQFFVSHQGIVHQYTDALARCVHAGPRGNKRGVGIEVQNRATDVRSERGITREILRETIHGVTTDRATLTAGQLRATLALTETLCRALGIPCVVPMRGPDVLSTLILDGELAGFRGVVGHLHLERAKIDPGLAVLRAIAARPRRGVDGAAE